MPKECEGCIAYYPEEHDSCRLAVISHISETEHCPCIDCLVKVVCDNTCEDFRRYGLKSREVSKRITNGE